MAQHTHYDRQQPSRAAALARQVDPNWSDARLRDIEHRIDQQLVLGRRRRFRGFMPTMVASGAMAVALVAFLVLRGRDVQGFTPRVKPPPASWTLPFKSQTPSCARARH